MPLLVITLIPDEGVYIDIELQLELQF